MLKQKSRLVAWGLYISDMLVTLGSLYMAYILRQLLSPLQGSLLPIGHYSFLPLIVLPVWSVLLLYFGLYRSHRLRTIKSEIWSITEVGIVGCFFLTAILFSLKIHFVSRLLIMLYGILNIILLSCWRAMIRRFARYVRKKEYNYRNILVVGTGKRAKELIDIIERHKAWGLKLIGVVGERITVDKLKGYPVLGRIDDISKIIRLHPVDEVLFCLPKSRLDALEDTFLMLEEEGITARVAMNFFPHAVAKVSFEELHGIPFLAFTTVPTDVFRLAIKRFFDVIISFISLIVLSPLLLVVAVGIKTTSKGPVFFAQVRSGLYGRKFRLYKFRSMYSDAEEKKRELMAQNEMDGPVFKIKKDPRVTPIGRMVRKLSIDELPQLWNVLKGDMSIVGPRPPLPSEVEHYERWQRRRLSMRPGLTCIWQVSGRNSIGFKDWMKMDLQYIDNWSLLLDLKILLKTIPVVLFCWGAS